MTWCRVLMVHFNGFYAWLQEPVSLRAHEDVRQTDLIQQAWADSGKVHGYRNLHDDLLGARGQVQIALCTQPLDDEILKLFMHSLLVDMANAPIAQGPDGTQEID